jgi:DNA mismatch repair protein MutL
MGAIKILPDELVSKIAAGEVVERPSSVVKELVENSIDANSENILIEIETGGKKLIQVTDDGDGMTHADAELALERYATSKIKSMEDLSSIVTLGFRGEALPSILACSRFELATKPKGALGGYLLKGEGGKVSERTEAGMPEGTRVSVRELFFNLPARQKFLRSAATEFSHIFDEVRNMALASPPVRLRLIHNGKGVLDLGREERREDRVTSLFGSQFLTDSLQVRFSSSPISIHGWCGESGQHNRADILFFVNGRRVRNRNLLYAVYRAYRSVSRERHPLILLFIEIVPSLIDINIHPRKSEVRFANERNVHELIFKSLLSALEDRGSIAQSEFVHTESLQDIRNLTNLPQLHNTYILLETEYGLVLVDQHAAHERILMERMEEKDMNVGSQNLLFPVTLELNSDLRSALLSHSEVIAGLGFGVDGFGGNTHIITSVPSICSSLDPQSLLVDVLQQLSDLGRVRDPRRELFKVLACKAAIKAGEPLTDSEKQRLIEDLFSCRAPGHCPHGRPTMVRVTLEELARRFGRS